ncbi:hypothetical protein ACFWY6_43810 [Streptomyces sp. NPDC059037]|uniref:hypothetical protein n=1 Tax=Streptomyces sp. NPDC059037 TaxID=3346710 RepID=UPI0036CD18BF
MIKTRQVATMLGGAAAVLAAMTVPTLASEAPSTAATAQSCSAAPYQSEAGTGPGNDAHWPNAGHWAVVSSGCHNISLMPNSGTHKVRVCTPSACNAWKSVSGGEWKVIAHNAVPGKKFYVQFKGLFGGSGWIEH